MGLFHGLFYAVLQFENLEAYLALVVMPKIECVITHIKKWGARLVASGHYIKPVCFLRQFCLAHVV